MAKALHIVGALIVLLVLSVIFHLIGWDWTVMPLICYLCLHGPLFAQRQSGAIFTGG
jgi:hypothetical protein